MRIGLHGITQDVTDFFFHTAAVTRSAALQTRFHDLFQITDNDLSHFDPISRYHHWYKAFIAGDFFLGCVSFGLPSADRR
ncbi:MAG: hypothetical protein WAV38_29535 [Xanthobacteraceae bacterium]